MKPSFNFMAAAFACSLLCMVPRALAAEKWKFTDNHPTGGPGATGKTITFNEGDPRFKIEGPGLCGQTFIGGTVEGHPDPRLTDPNAVCGHGIARLQAETQDPSRPLSIQPITEPIDPDAASAPAGDARRVIREQLPQLDRPEGDRVAAVRDLRRAVHLADAAKAARNLPRRVSK